MENKKSKPVTGLTIFQSVDDKKIKIHQKKT